jgi:molecular chaperone DnaK (HSP70)
MHLTQLTNFQSDGRYLIKDWPDADGQVDGRTSNEVPTTLVYDGNGDGYRWGFQIKDGEKRIERFKLGLCPEARQQQSYLNVKYPDILSKAPELTQKPTDLARDYLKKLHAHIIASLKSKLGAIVVETTPIKYVLTVPAVWSDKARNDTRECAISAGFGDDIHMITEPEAAVTFALDAMDPGTLNVGDTFVLVDGGGGTGDLISYCIEALEGGVKVKEAAPGTGALCGSSYLNNIFRNFLVKRFDEDPDWDDDILEDAMQRFEVWTKRHFRGEDSDFIIPVAGLAVNPPLGIHKRGKLRLTLEEMIKIFEPVVSMMATLVQSQIKATKVEVKAVLLVGGFGQSPYLKKMIQEIVGPAIEVLQPADGEVAVVKGALIKGLAHISPSLSRVLVTSRVATKSFGISLNSHFDIDKHDASKRYVFDMFDHL